MASYTGNLNLKKPALDDDALITDINNNMDILDAAANGIQDALAIVANGNTHVAISAGQFVYVRNHSTLTEGLYVASSNIAANATLSTSNLTADSAGGLNALNNNIAKKALSNITIRTGVSVTSNNSYQILDMVVINIRFKVTGNFGSGNSIFADLPTPVHSGLPSTSACVMGKMYNTDGNADLPFYMNGAGEIVSLATVPQNVEYIAHAVYAQE